MTRFCRSTTGPAGNIRSINLVPRNAAWVMLLALAGCASEGEPEGPTTPADTTAPSASQPIPSATTPVAPVTTVSPAVPTEPAPTNTAPVSPTSPGSTVPDTTQPDATDTGSTPTTSPTPTTDAESTSSESETSTSNEPTQSDSGASDDSDGTNPTDDTSDTGDTTQTEPVPSSPVSNLPPNPSGWPEPGEGGVVQPSGTAGNLEVLDWAGFKGAVSYSFDDCNSSQISNFQAMMDLDVPLTFYMWTGKSEASNPVWAEALAAGHELGNHTEKHNNPSSTDKAAETDAATEFLKNNLGTTPYTMAAPNGLAEYGAVANGRFLINRGVSGKHIAPNSNDDPFNLGSYVTGNSNNSVTWLLSNFNTQLDQSRSGGTWHILTMHGFWGGNDQAYGPVNLQDFVDAVNYAKSFGDVWIGTVEDIGAYWLGQKAFNAATPQDEAGGQTWSWSLPDNFPPDKYLRVTVDGGTLSQDSETLAWNEHGFYEISLDVGSLTLSP